MEEEIRRRDREHAAIEKGWKEEYALLKEKYEKAQYDSMMF
jgi:hypothetical protein